MKWNSHHHLWCEADAIHTLFLHTQHLYCTLSVCVFVCEGFISSIFFILLLNLLTVNHVSLNDVSKLWVLSLFFFFISFSSEFSFFLLLGKERGAGGAGSWKSSGMQGFLVYILPEYAAGAGLAPPSFFWPDVIVACVFYEWRNPTSESSGVIPGKGGLTFCRQSRFDPAGKLWFLY